MDWKKVRQNPFLNPQKKPFFVTSVVVLCAVWLLLKLLLDNLEQPLGSDTDAEEYYLLLSVSSLFITYLVGYILFTMISIDNIVKKKYDEIMNSLVYDDEGKKVYPGDPKSNFTASEWVRLSIEQHLDLLEVSSLSERLKADQLKLMLQNIDPKQNALQYADTTTMLSKKLSFLGEFDAAVDVCKTSINALSSDQDISLGQMKTALGLALKRAGDVPSALTELEESVILIPETEALRWVNANKALLRTQLLSKKEIPDESKLEEIHAALVNLCRSEFGNENYVNAWRLNSALESYCDLYSLNLASKGHNSWALRYSFAATILAESRTGTRASTYSTSHLSRLLMLEEEFESAEVMLNEKRLYLEERGDSRGWVIYNLARCKYGQRKFEDAIDLYTETIEMKNSDANTKLKAYIGLHYAHKELGNNKMSDSMKQEAEKLAISSGIEAVWEEPNKEDEQVAQPEEEWVVNQEKFTWTDAMKLARKQLGITDFRFPKKGTEFHKLTSKIYQANN